MCLECGCGQAGEVTIGGVATGQKAGQPPAHDAHGHSAPGSKGTHPEHDHAHDGHHHGHAHAPSATGGEGHPPQQIHVHQAILAKNDRQAERNRGYFQAKGLLVLNMVSAPGSGKTTLIQMTALGLGARLRTGVIVGDLATDNDAARLRTAGVPVVQITTGTVCHLEADMVARALTQLDLDQLDLLIIENVGNLVCPAVYDLGEDLRVVLLSATEGEDKPLKYPPMFHSADVAIITKRDLALPAGFERDQALANLHRISHHASVFEVSARTGEGMEAWCEFLITQVKAVRAGQRPQAHS